MLLRYIFDSEVGLFSRVVRKPAQRRGKAPSPSPRPTRPSLRRSAAAATAAAERASACTPTCSAVRRCVIIFWVPRPRDERAPRVCGHRTHARGRVSAGHAHAAPRARSCGWRRHGERAAPARAAARGGGTKFVCGHRTHARGRVRRRSYPPRRRARSCGWRRHGGGGPRPARAAARGGETKFYRPSIVFEPQISMGHTVEVCTHEIEGRGTGSSHAMVPACGAARPSPRDRGLPPSRQSPARVPGRERGPPQPPPGELAGGFLASEPPPVWAPCSFLCSAPSQVDGGAACPARARSFPRAFSPAPTDARAAPRRARSSLVRAGRPSACAGRPSRHPPFGVGARDRDCAYRPRRPRERTDGGAEPKTFRTARGARRGPAAIKTKAGVPGARRGATGGAPTPRRERTRKPKPNATPNGRRRKGKTKEHQTQTRNPNDGRERAGRAAYWSISARAGERRRGLADRGRRGGGGGGGGAGKRCHSIELRAHTRVSRAARAGASERASEGGGARERGPRRARAGGVRCYRTRASVCPRSAAGHAAPRRRNSAAAVAAAAAAARPRCCWDAA